MKHQYRFIILTCLTSAFANSGNPFFAGARWGFPLGASIDAGMIIPPHSNYCDQSEFGNICMGYSLSAEIGANGGRAGLGWSFLWSYGMMGLGTELSYLYQTPLIKDVSMGPWEQPERQAVGIDFNTALAWADLRFGPYVCLDENHKGDFLFRGTVGVGF